MRAEAQCVCGWLFVLDLQRRYGPSSNCGDQSLVALEDAVVFAV